MINLKYKIEHCLKKYPDTRNSDVKLTNAVWIEFHNNKIKLIDGKNYVALMDLYDMPRQDDVKRLRAKIQNEENKYLPTSLEVVKQRKINEEKWRNYMSPSNPTRG
jgi:hypothetical protein